jgi:hypothetical protein
MRVWKALPALAAASLALGQTLLVSPNPVYSVKREWMPYAKKATFTITSTADPVAWNVGTQAGELAPYFTVSPTSGTTPATVTINYNGMGSEALSVGTHSATIPVIPALGSTVDVTVQLEVRRRNAWPEFLYLQPPSCSNSEPFYPFADTCAILNERPPSTYAGPAVGETVVDPTFGGKIKRITPDSRMIQYSTRTAFSATGKYIVTAEIDGFVSVFDVRRAAVVYANVPGNINYWNWDAYDDEIYYYFSGAQIVRRNLRAGTSAVAADYSGSPWFFTFLSDGGTVDITDDGWWAFEADGGQVCAVDLNGISAANQAGKTYCASIAGVTPSIVYLDFPQITKVDSQSKKRYVVLVASPQGVVYSVNTQTGILDYEYKMPEVPQYNRNNDNGVCEAGEACLSTPHSDVFEAADGTQHFYYTFPEIWMNETYLAILQLNKGGEMHQPLESGGGMNMFYPNSCSNCDNHLGCSNKLHGCVFSMAGPYGAAAQLISTATNAAPAAIATSAAHGWSTGQDILIGSAEGNTCINGLWQITVTGATTGTLNGSDCSGAGTYTGDTGIAVNGSQTPASPMRNELALVRPGEEIRRLATHRSKIYNDLPGTPVNFYYSTPRASISRNGDLIAYNSNYGGTGGASVYVLETGTRYDRLLEVRQIRTLQTKAVIEYEVPEPLSCNIRVSGSPTLDTIVESVSDNQTARWRTTVLGGLAALTPGTDYHVRLTCGMYTATRRFRTLESAGIGNTAVRLQFGRETSLPNAASVLVEFGYPETGAPGSFSHSSGAVSCSQGCSVALDATRGRILYYRAKFQDASAAVIAVKPIQTVAVQ